MKKINTAIIILFSFFMSSCTEVVSVDLTTETPRLVVEAPLQWQKGTDGKAQKIKLTTTTSFYSTDIPTVSGAQVIVKNSSNTTFVFTELLNTGEYFCTDFVPVINEVYTLTITLNGIVYSASETMKAVAPIDQVVQNNEGGIGKDQIQIKTFFTDPAEVNNYYLSQYTYENKLYKDFSVTDDEFFQGNQFFSLSNKDDLKIGDVVNVTHYGISKTYYNYLSILITIAGGSSGGPFQSPPATVRGNIINITNKDNYALGFFSVSETDTRTLTIQ